MKKKSIVALLSCSILLIAIGSFVASKSSRVIISDNIEALTKNYDAIPGPNGITYRAIRMGQAATPEEIDEYSHWYSGCYLTTRPVSVYDNPMEFYDSDRPGYDVLDHCYGTNKIFPYTIKAIDKWCWARFGPEGTMLSDF